MRVCRRLRQRWMLPAAEEAVEAAAEAAVEAGARAQAQEQAAVQALPLAPSVACAADSLPSSCSQA